MRCRVNGVEYDVRFNTSYREDEFQRVKEPLRDIQCTISEVDETKEGTRKYSLITDGWAFLSHRDVHNFNHWAGKKLAFTRAVNSQISEHEYLFNKNERYQFWQVYKKYHQGRKLTSRVSM